MSEGKNRSRYSEIYHIVATIGIIVTIVLGFLSNQYVQNVLSGWIGSQLALFTIVMVLLLASLYTGRLIFSLAFRNVIIKRFTIAPESISIEAENVVFTIQLETRESMENGYIILRVRNNGDVWQKLYYGLKEGDLITGDLRMHKGELRLNWPIPQNSTSGKYKARIILYDIRSNDFIPFSKKTYKMKTTSVEFTIPPTAQT